MSATVCRTPTTVAVDTCSAPTKIPNQYQDEEQSDQSAVRTMIQSQKPPTPNRAATPYVHSFVSRSFGLMSKSSLEMCTESLGSETGSGDFSVNDRSLLNSFSSEDGQVVVKHKKLQKQTVFGGEVDGNQLMSVNYHYSVGRRSLVPRTFPPPLSSVSRRDCTCIQMRTCRHDGHLVVDAVPVSSQNYLHARRHEGRLLLTFINSTATSQPTAEKTIQEPLVNNEEQMIEQVVPASKEINQSKEVAEDKEGEKELLDSRTMVEAMVSSQPQHPSTGSLEAHLLQTRTDGWSQPKRTTSATIWRHPILHCQPNVGLQQPPEPPQLHQ